MEIKVDGNREAYPCPFNWDDHKCHLLMKTEGPDDCPVWDRDDIPEYCPLRKESIMVRLDYKGYKCTVCGWFFSPDDVKDLSACPNCHSTESVEGNQGALVPGWKFTD